MTEKLKLNLSVLENSFAPKNCMALLISIKILPQKFEQG